MQRRIVATLTGVLAAAGMVGGAPPANAGCLSGGPGILGKCDGPVQPDGSWERCVVVARLVPNGASSFLMPDKHCDVVGPDQHPADQAFADPPTHIDG